MKILGKLLSLVCVTPIFAYTFLNNKNALTNESSIYNIYKRDVVEDEYNKLSKECRKAIKEVKEKCLMEEEFEMLDLNSFCMYYDTDMCQNLYINGTDSIPACKNQDLNIFNMNVTIIYFYKKYRCAIDEDGKPCPFNKMDATNRKSELVDNKKRPVEQREQEFYVHVNNTCKSKMCHNVYKNYIEDFYKALNVEQVMNQTLTPNKKIRRKFEIENYDEDSVKTFESAIIYLNTDECLQIYEENQKALLNSDDESGYGTNLFNQNRYMIYITLVTILLFLI